MSEEVSIHIGIPTVHQAKVIGASPYAEVRAETKASSFSVHYRTQGEVPAVRERLLVAVLSGVRHAWIDDAPGQEQVPIRFEGVSALPVAIVDPRISASADDPLRAEQFDTLRFSAATTVADGGGHETRLRVSMKDESGDTVHAAVVLSKGQVTSMLAALLAIYPRLEEL